MNMARRTNLLQIFLLSLCLFGATLCDNEIQDFEFADSDNEVKIVKRAAVYTDDEDFLANEPDLAPEGEEGSGVPGLHKHTVLQPLAGVYPRYYRVKITFESLVFVPSLANRNSAQFQQLSAQLQRDIQSLFRTARGEQTVTVLSFSDGSVVVTFDLGSDGSATEEELRGMLEDAIRSGRIGTNTVSPEAFSFTAIDDVVRCPSYVGREPDALPRNGSNFASLMINNFFPCAGKVVAWEYYRVVSQGLAFVGVWRSVDSEFLLVDKTELPPAPVGYIRVDLEYPVEVEIGDFIGIFYPRSTANNVVAQATLDDDAVFSHELYQTHFVQFYEDSVQLGENVDLRRFPTTATNATFSIRAVMDYEGISRDIGYHTCASNQFSCGDTTCIESEHVCDTQPDCETGLDEQNCPLTTSVEEPCLEGRFRCTDGTCIARILRCDGKADCPDGLDERCEPCREGEFTCKNNECVSESLRCNGQSDCQDKSDEDNCPTVCKEDDFRCDSGECIHVSRVCDAFPDCEDNSDENPDRCLSQLTTFPPTCPAGYFKCIIGGCVEISRLCDARRDCLDGSDEADCSCGPAEFTCDNGQCVDLRRRCDFVPDCVDQSDESGCPCRSDQFECSDGQCISGRQRCDRSVDCRDGSDERECPCLENEFTCGDGQCISSSRVCDGTVDCRDSSDEHSNCARCRRNEFECNDGTCIDRRNKCDRSPQCPDFSDEFNCTCNTAEFRCGNGQCVPRDAYCDQTQDCFDATDEINCPVTCRVDQFTCEDGECIDLRRVCDRRTDCRDRSDEQNCPTCAPSEFTCASGQCISNSQRCDRRTDCPDGSDERNCPCAPDEFTCVSDGRCLPPGYRCNRNADCRDGSDEIGCVPQCTAREFRCSSNQCVDLSAQCDGRIDCSDGSDERNCPGVTVTVSPQYMKKRTGTSASFICQVAGTPPSRIVWSRRTGGAMPAQAVDAGGRLTIINLRLEDAGDYVCQAETTLGNFEAVARLEVDYIGPATEAPGPDGPCGREESTCSNGQCIPKDYVCDGEADCSDGSDETSCRTVLPCEPNEFRCNNGRCALKIWRCDGDDDCLDNSDETSCPTRIPGAPCQSDEFVCRTNNQCIPMAYQCDGELDCQDRSDEIGCIPPSIVVPPVPEITVEINGTFTIICEAVGVPTPLIVWRLNWGNIPSGDRVTVTSVDGRGTLIIRNAIPEDSGAYTCEAINNRGSIFAIPDALIIVRRTIGICNAPRFNVDAATPEECVRCFCFGQTQTCYSSNLQISQITLGNQVALVRRQTLEPTEQGFIQYIPSSREFEVRDFNNVIRTGSYYWSLPYQYLSKRLSSYGGELTYRVYYEVDGFDVPTSDPDVIITGNGITIHHRSQSAFRPRTPTTVRVPLIESAWERSRDSPRGGPISEYATREDLMLVLENVTSLLIRASYDNRQSLIRLGNVLLTTGVSQTTGLGRAVRVEECTCPTGYTGYSCEECAPGFYKVERGRYSRECVACNCNGHSNDCDAITGVCRNCQDNTAGPYCNECVEGFVGDPRSSRPDACQPCPCPLTTSPNQFSRTCVLDGSGEIVCTACPVGYTGRKCERCSPGYQGNPLIPGDRCIQKGADVCDERGSVSTLPDAITQQCSCKPNVESQLCSRCKPGSFHLSSENPYGCISCFCMGVSQTCQSTTWNRAQVSLPFSQSAAGVILTDMMRRESVTEGLSIDRQTRELVFRGFNNVDRSIRYWSLPQQFLGDKVTSYGGNLRFTARYRAGRDSTPVSLNDPLIEIGGNDIVLLHRTRTVIPEGIQQSFSVPLIETQWFRMDGEPATREHLLMALADLDFILIRAAHTRETEEAAISGISLDIAESRETGQERAYSVEQCACPRGYKGLSCEDCDTGYTRSGSGLYLGLCEPCQCYGHSSECDPATGVCRNCRHNTQGDHCERCSRGYYGDATRGSVNDCQKCPCPLTDSPNQFSPECVLSSDRQVTCTACPIGHTGRRCERCAPGYQGNPNQPGDYCKLINVTCDCDPRGTVPNTLCDPNTQQCQCKNNVQGRRCSTCRDGYFNLDRNNEMGCLRCFCMGVSSRCSSSNYYRDEIVPMLNSDGSHNFQLTNRRLSRTISDGFTINADRNEITFSSFEGIQRELESLFFALPPKFRGDKISSYGGTLKFSLSYTTSFDGREYMDVDVEIIGKQDKRIYYLHQPSPKAGESYSYEILLTESSFKFLEGQAPSREAFLTILADIDAILIRATYHTAMGTVTLRDLSMQIAVPRPTGQPPAPEVESCICPEGYTGLSCQECAAGYLRVEDSATALGRCVRCSCNGHATSCDPETGVCQNCQHNTVGDRCERCAPGFYGDPAAGTAYDCRPCPCPLTLPSNQFSPTCFLDQDTRVTCDRCPTGYTGRDCGQCAPGFTGNPREPGGLCERVTVVQAPQVIVNPASLSAPLGTTAVFQCVPSGRSPFNVVWSRLDGRQLPRRATQGPGPNYLLTIPNLEFADSARYVCQVTNAYGTVREQATLNVEQVTRPVKVRIEEPTNVVARPGGTVRLVCVAVQYSSAANYVLSWERDGVLPSKATDFNGVLTIPNLNEADLGTYTCIGSEPGSSDRATATITFGTVLEAPSVRIEPRYIQISEGGRVDFKCIAEGSPRPVVRWTKGQSDPLPSHIYTDESGTFRINSVSMNDQSEYYCTASNSQGTSSVRTIIYVQSQPKIQVITRRTNITAVIGQSEQLICYAEGNNEVILIWSREGGLPLGATQQNGVLTLSNIQPSYAGTYICTGRTPTGIVGTATARITVTGTLYSSPTARIDPERQVIGSGMTGTLHCIVTGEPRPTITWSRARGPLTSNIQVSGEYLRFLQASMDDRDIYLCSANNVAGNAQASAILDIERRELPVIELYPNIQTSRPLGSSALFRCRVIGGVPVPTVTWTRSGGLEFTSRTEVRADLGEIRFSSIGPEEQGEYVCSATNEVGTVTATASLRAEGPPVIQITPSKRITSLVGQIVNIECVGIGDPTPTVFWRPGDRRRSDVLPEAYQTSPGTAILQFDAIQKADAGRYICVAANEKGRVEETVEVSVFEGEGHARPSVSISGPERLSVSEGMSVQLTCSSQGLQNPRIRWKRPGNLPLPPGHSVSNGVLYIPRIDLDSTGEYICSVDSETLSTEFSAKVYIIVTVTPRLTITPTRVVSRPGLPLQLRCQPGGQGPFRIEWTKLDGQLSQQARERDGVLEIGQLTRADAGRYRCIVTSSGGTGEGFADVVVLAPPVIDVVPIQNQAVSGSTLEIRCNAQGDPAPSIQWQKDRGQLPLQHQIRNGILTIYNLQPKDAGRYVCTASNDVGTVSAYSIVVVEDTYVSSGPGVVRVNVTERVELECVPSGSDPPPAVSWTRVGGPVPQSAIIGSGILIIPEVRLEDAGTYQCTVANANGVVRTRVELIVQSRPVFSVQQDYTTAALGNPAHLRCDASGSPEPQYTWIKEDGDLPDDHSTQDGDLFIPKVRKEDGGTYNCLASNMFGTSKYPIILLVGAFVPYFRQNPLSYISYEPLTDVYMDLDILLSFRPEDRDGLLLYNGQYNSNSGDFVCFGLQGQYPEFRYDVGSGPATIRGAQPLELNTWHTVHLKRNGKNGTLLVNDEAAYYGESAGVFQTLDLGGPLYVGNVPDTQLIPGSARFRQGFVGGVSQIKIKGIDLDLGLDAQEIKGVEQYQVCGDRPCGNRGSCRPYNNKYGFVCECPRGFSGDRCEQAGERCYPGACGPRGRCYNLPAVSGFGCVCPFGFSGVGCAQRIRVADPAFNKTSFISYPTISGGLLSVQVRLLLKPMSLDDGIILYNAQRQDGKQDFIAVIIQDGYLEFRFDTGSGPAVLRSRSTLKMNDWTMVLIDRKGRDGMLIVNDDDVVSEQVQPSDELLFSRLDRGDIVRGTTSGNRTLGLNLERPLYLGGVDPFESIHPDVGTRSGFVGCIGELSIGDSSVRLAEDAIESLNIEDCGDRRLCERLPCRNDGQCVDLSPTQYRCVCPQQYTGTNCEIEIDICVTRQPCQNGGQCVVAADNFRCNCPLPWMGETCSHQEPLLTSVEVIGHGYVEFSKDLLPHQHRNTIEVISVTITTTESSGLIFWQGQLPGNQGGKDFLALALNDGYVEFRYELGSGPGLIRSVSTINDGYPHVIVAERLGRNGSLSIDNELPVKGASRGALQVVNVPGSIYFGGVPDLGQYTDNLFSNNYVGCLTNIRLQNRVLNFDTDPLGGLNVTPCMQAK